MSGSASYGAAHGWRVSESELTGRWAWWAYGPRGTHSGTSSSKRAAEKAAQAAERGLTEAKA